MDNMVQYSTTAFKNRASGHMRGGLQDGLLNQELHTIQAARYTSQLTATHGSNTNQMGPMMAAIQLGGMLQLKPRWRLWHKHVLWCRGNTRSYTDNSGPVCE